MTAPEENPRDVPITNKRVLVITSTDPMGQVHGAQMRLRMVLEVLSEFASIDLVVIQPRGASRFAASRPATVDRILRVEQERVLKLADRVRWWLQPKVPLTLVGRNHSRVESVLRGWMHDEYSLIWLFRTDHFASVSNLLANRPMIVDVDDLEAVKASAAMEVRRQEAKALTSKLLLIPARLQGARDRKARMRYDRAVAEKAIVSLVCSEEDARSLNVSGALVVPNGYPPPSTVARHPALAPVILLQGSLTYAPNADAAEYFIRDIWPILLENYPTARLRLVGRTSPKVDALAGPSVDVVGYVDDINGELSGAHLIVAPIRFGGGTRIKILEAFAHGIPVVSTTTGAFGLGAVSGTHLLIEDDPIEFARACIEVLGNPSLGLRLAREARALYESRFTIDAVKYVLRGELTSYFSSTR